MIYKYITDDVSLELNNFMKNYMKENVININIEVIKDFYDCLMKNNKIFDNQFINDVNYLVKRLQNKNHEKSHTNTFLEYLLNIISYYILCISYDKNKINVLCNIFIDYYNNVITKTLNDSNLEYYNYLLNLLKNIIEKNKKGDFKDYIFIKHYKIKERNNKYISYNIVNEYIEIYTLLKHICVINEENFIFIATIFKKNYLNLDNINDNS